MSPLASGDRRLAPPFRPAAAHDSDHVTARLGRPAARAAFPPCGCARLRSCHRSPRATGGWRRLSALRLRTTSDHVTARLGRPAAGVAFPPCGCARPPIMSPLASGDRRLAPPFPPAAAPDPPYEPDVVGVGAAARADDGTAGGEQGRGPAGHCPPAPLAGPRVA